MCGSAPSSLESDVTCHQAEVSATSGASPRSSSAASRQATAGRRSDARPARAFLDPGHPDCAGARRAAATAPPAALRSAPPSRPSGWCSGRNAPRLQPTRTRLGRASRPARPRDASGERGGRSRVLSPEAPRPPGVMAIAAGGRPGGWGTHPEQALRSPGRDERVQIRVRAAPQWLTLPLTGDRIPRSRSQGRVPARTFSIA